MDFTHYQREATPKHNFDLTHYVEPTFFVGRILRVLSAFSKQFHPPVVPACASSAYGSHVQQLLTSVSMNTRSPQCLTVAGRRVSSRRERLILRQGSGLVS